MNPSSSSKNDINLSNSVIPSIYRILLVGSGAYGIVIACEDLKANNEDLKNVAIKKIERTFEHRFYAKRTLRELKILRNLKHENVLSFINLFLDR